MQIHKGKRTKPRRVLLYGQEGVGKSSWAAQAPRPLFLNFEDGLSDLDVESTERINTWDEAREALNFLRSGDHSYQSIVFDTVDWMEKLIHAHICQEQNVKTIEKASGGYGKGYKDAELVITDLCTKLDALMLKRNVNIIMLGHCTACKVNDPRCEMYEQWSPDLHKLAASVLREWCDEVLFAGFQTFVRSSANNDEKGKKPQRFLGMGGDERFICTTRSAAVQAKNRLQLPPELPMQWAEYQKYWPGQCAQAEMLVPKTEETVSNG